MALYRNIKEFLVRLIRHEQQRLRPMVLVIASSLVIFFLWDRGGSVNSSEASQALNHPLSYGTADTYIPRGYVLIPIEIQNRESLESLFGEQGVVDLFSAKSGDRPGARVASHVRMIRAPLNPNQFAVLVPEAQSTELVQHAGAFFVLLQNPKSHGSTFDARPRPPKRLVIENLGGGE